MKIYTKTGDDGSTGLFGGERVQKSDVRIQCSGTVDELNAAIGLAVVNAPGQIIGKLRKIQDDLFVLGSHLSAPADKPNASLPQLEPSIVERLEKEIDLAEAALTPLRNFILPGGSETAARLHLARTICRRSERLLVDFSHQYPLPAIMTTYVNRLSDWLFVHARLANSLAGVEDIPWNPRSK